MIIEGSVEVCAQRAQGRLDEYRTSTRESTRSPRAQGGLKVIEIEDVSLGVCPTRAWVSHLFRSRERLDSGVLHARRGGSRTP